MGAVYAILPGTSDSPFKIINSANRTPFSCLQGILFYVPHWIWKNWEDGKIRMISDGMRGVLTASIDERVSRQRRLIKYIYDSIRTHNTYSAGYFFCEALNFVNVVGNIFFVDKFLGGAFLTYGTEVVKFSNMNQENRSDPMVEVFPRVTKCTFHKFGASGSIQSKCNLLWQPELFR